MFHDYAKQKQQCRHRKIAKIIITIVVIIIAISAPLSAVYYRFFHKSPTTPAAKAPTHPTQPIPVVMKSSALNFDFYALLAKANITSPMPNNRSAHPPAHSTVNITNKTYQLQVAAFKRSKDASKFSKSLRNLGFNVSIYPHHDTNGQLWHRVLVGPFSALHAVSQAQATLAHYHIPSLLIKTP